MKRRMIRDIQACLQCMYIKGIESLNSYYYICTKYNKCSKPIGMYEIKEINDMDKWFQDCEVWEVVE